jgi:chaperonin GroEL
MSKDLFFHGEVKTKLKVGLDKLADTVKLTLGPMGRNVIIEQTDRGPVVTKDGVTVANKITLPDPVENMGAMLVKEVASKTNGAVGDGTTTATVLAQAIVTEGMKLDMDSQQLRRELEEASELVLADLKAMARPVEGEAIKHVARISANDAELGDLIASVVEKVGKNGVVTVEQSNDFGVKVRQVEGLQFTNGYASPHLMTNRERQEAEYLDIPVLLVDQKLDDVAGLAQFLGELVNTGVKKAVVIAEDYDDSVLGMICMNKLQGAFNGLLIKAPSFGDRRSVLLDDIALLTGGTVVSEKNGVKLKGLQILGKISKIVSTKDNTTIIGGSGDKERLKVRVTELEEALANEQQGFEKEFIKERLGKLTGGVAIISVGAPSEVEMIEKRHRIEDAVNATKAAMEEGIVAGGGMALLRASRNLEASTAGAIVLETAITEPFKQIARNAGKDPVEVMGKIVDDVTHGWNARTDKIVDMFEAGIVDPLKVTRSALQNAVSVAIMILTTEAGITEHKDYEQKSV